MRYRVAMTSGSSGCGTNFTTKPKEAKRRKGARIQEYYFRNQPSSKIHSITVKQLPWRSPIFQLNRGTGQLMVLLLPCLHILLWCLLSTNTPSWCTFHLGSQGMAPLASPPCPYTWLYAACPFLPLKHRASAWCSPWTLFLRSLLWRVSCSLEAQDSLGIKGNLACNPSFNSLQISVSSR